MKKSLAALLIFMLCGCASSSSYHISALSSAPTATTQVCIALQNRETYWSVAAKVFALAAGAIPGIGWTTTVAKVVAASLGILSAGSGIMATGESNDYFLYGCPAIQTMSSPTSTK